MQERPRILIAEPDEFSPGALALLREVGEVQVGHPTGSDLAQALRDYNAVWFRLAHRIDAAMLQGGLRCRLLACAVTGLDHIDLDACAAKGIEVISLKGQTEFLKEVRATAELAVALAMALMRNISRAAESVLAGQWDRDTFRGHELYGKTAGIVGLGRLGTIVARYLDAFGMTVIGYDPVAIDPIDGVQRESTLRAVLERADVVSLHVSYDDSTHHLIGAPELAWMKPSAVLVNTSRGGVVHTEALLEALSAQRLAGAALDVLEGEPAITADHPAVRHARDHGNLLIVPHIGGCTFESTEKTEMHIARRVAAALTRDSTA